MGTNEGRGPKGYSSLVITLGILLEGSMRVMKNHLPRVPDDGSTWFAKPAVAILVAVHFAILLIGAAAASPSSELQQALAGKFLGYYQLLDLGQGYRFYAPRPAPTAIVTAKLKIRDKDGRVRYETVRIPERGTRPRLRLQRQLALANSLWSEFERQAAGGHQGHLHEPILAKAYARHLGKKVEGCESVELFLHRHPDPVQVERAYRAGEVITMTDLEDERYRTPTESLGSFPCD